MQMLQEGLQPNLVTYNTLLEVYAKRGMWGKAVGVLDTLEQQVGRAGAWGGCYCRQQCAAVLQQTRQKGWRAIQLLGMSQCSLQPVNLADLIGGRAMRAVCGWGASASKARRRCLVSCQPAGTAHAATRQW
eukprot:GHRQ01022485.1.p3 GENE.GHRQ01022485.1~~GHRQ01022485.1.p3  ORF type:complete len:131 (+),score=34.62 GHRQ01022485.1:836-1228(+)